MKMKMQFFALGAKCGFFDGQRVGRGRGGGHQSIALEQAGQGDTAETAGRSRQKRSPAVV